MDKTIAIVAIASLIAWQSYLIFAGGQPVETVQAVSKAATSVIGLRLSP